MRRAALCLFALSIVAASALPAQAIPPLLRPGTRPMWASGAFGPSISTEAGWPTQFKLVETFGWHFSGTASGPAIAVDLQESVGSSVVVFELVPNFVWDIPIVDGLGFYLSPGGGLGFAHAGCTGCRGLNGMTIQLTFKAKLMLGDRGMVFFQPVGIDVLMGDQGAGWDATVRWDMLWGGGVTF